MNILLMGPAGSGKGTMSSRIVSKYGVTHLATGDLLRNAMKNETELGKSAKQFINQGKLVPDEIVISLVEEKIAENVSNEGYLMDGFPRTIPQALTFDELAANLDNGIDVVIHLVIDFKELVKRITGRRLCKKCGAIYHITNNPPKVDGICDYCNNELMQRSDDTEEQLTVRLSEYENNTKAVLTHYAEKGLLKKVDAAQDIEKVWADVMSILEAIND